MSVTIYLSIFRSVYLIIIIIIIIKKLRERYLLFLLFEFSKQKNLYCKIVKRTVTVDKIGQVKVQLSDGNVYVIRVHT